MICLEKKGISRLRSRVQDIQIDSSCTLRRSSDVLAIQHLFTSVAIVRVVHQKRDLLLPFFSLFFNAPLETFLNWTRNVFFLRKQKFAPEFSVVQLTVRPVTVTVISQTLVGVKRLHE